MDYFKEQDKYTAAYLLTCKTLKFQGTHAIGEVLFFLFSPVKEASKLSDLYLAKQAEPIQPKELFEAEKTVTDLIWKWRKAREAGRI